MERDAFLGHNGKSFVRMELVKVSGFSRLHNSFVFIARFYVYRGLGNGATIDCF